MWEGMKKAASWGPESRLGTTTRIRNFARQRVQNGNAIEAESYASSRDESS